MRRKAIKSPLRKRSFFSVVSYMLAVTCSLFAIFVFQVVTCSIIFVFPVLRYHKVDDVFRSKWYCSSIRVYISYMYCKCLEGMYKKELRRMPNKTLKRG